MYQFIVFGGNKPQRFPASPVSDTEADFNITDYNENIEDKIFNDSNKILILVERVEVNKTFSWMKDISNLTESERITEEASLKKMSLNLLEFSENKDTMITPQDIEDFFIGNGYEPVLVVDNRPDFERKRQNLRKIGYPLYGLGVVGIVGIAISIAASLPASGPLALVLIGATSTGLIGGGIVSGISIKNYNRIAQYHFDNTVSLLIHDAVEDWRQQEGIEQLDFVSMFNPREVNIEIE